MRRLLTWMLMGLVAGTMGLAWGQDNQGNNAPPTSNALVARLSAISGTVSTQRGDTGEWATGAINTPLVSGDKVAAGEDSKAEVQLDYADLLRLAGNTQANLTNLSKDQIQVQIAAGLADFVVLKRAQAASEIDTPNIAIRPRRDGVYRVEVDSDSQTVVIVRKGEADISTPQGSTLLRSGQQMTVEGTDAPEYKIADAPGRDDWDRWNQQRDDSVQAARSFQYTNPYYTGVQDLDGYGYWTSVPGYGQVWVPNEGDNWTPYSDGRWQWEPYWGWTWVDYSPWGWAPYHYGRWFVYGPRWVWWPGPITPYYQPVWAPAYVSFFGWGGGFGVGVGFGWGSIGWLPIGPCDPFRPWWGGGFGRNRVNVVNVTNITNITNINNFNTVNIRNGRIVPPLAAVGRGRVAYSNLASLNNNARVRAAVMRVPANDFGRGVLSARQHVTPVELRTGKAFSGSLPVVPDRASLSTGRAVSARALPRNAATHFFGTRGTAARPSFTQERGQIASRLQNAPSARFSGRTETPASSARVAAGANGGENSGMRSFGRAPETGRVDSRTAPAPRAVTPQPARPASGMTRFGRGEAAPANQNRPTSPGQNTAQPLQHGWQRFGSPAGGNAPATGHQTFAPAGREQAPARSFDRGASPAPTAPENRVQPQARPGWQHFSPSRGGEPSNGSAGRGFDQPSSSAPRSFERAPSYNPGNSRGNMPSYSRGDSGSRPPLEVGHPIVEAPRPSYRPSGNSGYRPSPQPSYHPSYGGGGSRMSTPHVSEPHMSAPSTPHSSGGGSGSRGGGGHPHV